jgi:hypothetical protein
VTAIVMQPPAPTPPRRILPVARVLLSNPAMAIGWPLAIMGASFFFNLLILGGLRSAIEQPTTGGLASLYIVQLVVGWQGLYQTFSFAVGLNASRRSFFAAAVVVAFCQSAVFGLFLYVCGIVERATGGFGFGLRFFDPLPLTHSASPVTVLVYAAPLLLMSALGLFLGAVTRRWGGNGIFVLTVIVMVVAGSAVALVSYLDGWPAVGAWLAARSWLSITIGWSLIPTALAVAGGWLVLRRAVP